MQSAQINSLNFLRLTAFGQQLGECTIATTDVHALQSSGQLQPFEKILADAAAPDAHHAFVSGAVVKANFLIGHAEIIPL